jgi:hypothetical protein
MTLDLDLPGSECGQTCCFGAGGCLLLVGTVLYT